MSAPAPRTTWWWSRSVTFRRTVRAILTLLVAALLSLGVGVATARVNTPIGPHDTTISTTLSHDIRVRLGPLGGVVIDSPLPRPLGVQVDVHEIPITDPTADLGTQLTADLNAYLQLGENPQAALAGPKNALIANVLGRASVCFGLILVLITALRLATGGHARAALGAMLRRRFVAPLVATAAVTGAALVVAPLIKAPVTGARPIAALADTPFAGVRVVGQLGPLLDAGAKTAVGQYNQTQDFYAGVIEDAATRLSLAPAPILYRPLDERGAATDPVLAGDDDIVTALFVSDLHCNFALADAIGAIASDAGADLIINGGDTTTNGTAAEQFCVDIQASGWGGIPVVVADGNHDTPVTSGQERAAGWRVLDGGVIEVAGLKILGDSDPTHTQVGRGTYPQREETLTEMGTRIAEQSCDQQLDLVLTHNPRMARLDANTNCAPLWLSGHVHRRVGPELAVGTDGFQVRYTNASTGRGLKENTVMGPMYSDAEMTIVRMDKTRHQPIDLQVVAVQADGTVRVDERQPVSALADETSAAAEPAADTLQPPTPTDG